MAHRDISRRRSNSVGRGRKSVASRPMPQPAVSGNDVTVRQMAEVEFDTEMKKPV
jgi:hypothetical protein